MKLSNKIILYINLAVLSAIFLASCQNQAVTDSAPAPIPKSSASIPNNEVKDKTENKIDVTSSPKETAKSNTIVPSKTATPSESPKSASEQAKSNQEQKSNEINNEQQITATNLPINTPEVQNNVCQIAIIGEEKTILSLTAVEIGDNNSVLDILKKITQEKKIQMEFRGGSKSGAYVEGIDNLYEFDRGAKSGWRYSVNGAYPSISCGAYIVKKGDVINWRYTKDMGKDLTE